MLTEIFGFIVNISIHALREESDGQATFQLFGCHDFNPRPPRGERLDPHGCQFFLCRFQSTPSARRATCPEQRQAIEAEFQSTPSARRATLQGIRPVPTFFISIHALREESDVSRKESQHMSIISIHALREESDGRHSTWKRSPPDFNPRPPRGERLGR